VLPNKKNRLRAATRPFCSALKRQQREECFDRECTAGTKGIKLGVLQGFLCVIRLAI